MANLTLAELQSLSATAMLSSFRSGELSPVDVSTAAFACIEVVNPHINAVIYTNKEAALAEARASEQRWRRGEPRGRLDGVDDIEVFHFNHWSRFSNTSDPAISAVHAAVAKRLR